LQPAESRYNRAGEELLAKQENQGARLTAVCEGEGENFEEIGDELCAGIPLTISAWMTLADGLRETASKVRDISYCVAHIISAQNDANVTELRIRTAASWVFMPGLEIISQIN
jgi:hypothetical protein